MADLTEHCIAVAAKRLAIWNNGYRPLAVYGPGHPSKSAGKRPVGLAWEERARQNPPEAVVEPAMPEALNTGILCDGLRVIDIDIDDADLAGQIRRLAEQMLGGTIVRIRANSPRCMLIYRAFESEPAKRSIKGAHGNKVEVLGKGNQCVAFGGHPSGVALKWSGGSPETVKAADLPAVMEQQVADLLTAVADLIGAPPTAKARAAAIRTTERATTPGMHCPADQAPPSRDHIIRLLDTMPNHADVDREIYVRVNLAVQGSICGGVAQGMLTPEDADAIRDAAARWSARWACATEDFDVERERWRRDWSRCTVTTGWRHLLGIARQFGVDVAEYDAATAAQDFVAIPPEEEAAPLTLADGWMGRLQYDGHNEPLNNLANAMIAMRPHCANASVWI